VNNE